MDFVLGKLLMGRQLSADVSQRPATHKLTLWGLADKDEEMKKTGLAEHAYMPLVQHTWHTTGADTSQSGISNCKRYVLWHEPYSSKVATYKCITFNLEFSTTQQLLSARVCLHVVIIFSEGSIIKWYWVYISDNTRVDAILTSHTHMHAILKRHTHKIIATKTSDVSAPSSFLQYNGLRSCWHVHYCEPEASRSSKKRTGTYVPMSQS